jgi:excisionase family DNA binding protein
MSAIFTALIADATEDDLQQLAQLLTPFLHSQPNTNDVPGWLNLEQACEHLASKPSRLYALVSARRIPFAKDGSRLLFRRDELDKWVAAGGATRP